MTFRPRLVGRAPLKRATPLDLSEIETFCILSEGGKWRVFYSERGSRFDMREFRDEGEACRYFLGLWRI
jgi:hypothetical protein